MSAVNELSEEDEFAVSTKLIGTATHIIGLEQRPIIKGEYVVLDFFCKLRSEVFRKGKISKRFQWSHICTFVNNSIINNFDINMDKDRLMVGSRNRG